MRLSEPLLAVRIIAGGGNSDMFGRMCRKLSQDGVNMVFAAMDSSCQPSFYLCCVARDDGSKATALLGDDDQLKDALSFYGPVGVVDLFPHQHRFLVLCHASAVLAAEGIRVHGMASSLSALSFVIDYKKMGKSAAALSKRFRLPAGNDAPCHLE